MMKKHQFYLYIFNKNTKCEVPIQESDMLLIGETNINTDSNDYFEQVSNNFNSLLRNFLIKNNIYQFIPLINPSIEVYDELVTVCYYHNMLAYNLIYSHYPKYILHPAH